MNSDMLSLFSDFIQLLTTIVHVDDACIMREACLPLPHIFFHAANTMNQANFSKGTSRSLVIPCDGWKQLAGSFTFDVAKDLLLLICHLIKIKPLLQSLFHYLLVFLMLIISLVNLLVADCWVSLKNPSHEAHIFGINRLSLTLLEYYAQ